MYYEVYDVIKYMQRTSCLFVILIAGILPITSSVQVAVLCDEVASSSTPFTFFNSTKKDKGRY